MQEVVQQQSNDQRGRHRKYRNSIGENRGGLRPPRETERRHLVAFPRVATAAPARKVYIGMCITHAYRRRRLMFVDLEIAGRLGWSSRESRPASRRE